jgi:D-beta-D-heptose 7-phosphate kinase/D-beta-D-heptose 1-phosphate adenosyltransferase
LDRAAVLSALESVDYIVMFDEDTPIRIVSEIKPDVLVKGGDYTLESVIGREHAHETVILPYLSGKSTSEIIKRIIKLN